MNALDIRQAKLNSLAGSDIRERRERTRLINPLFSEQNTEPSQMFFAEIHQAAQYNGTGFDATFVNVVKLYDGYADAIVVVTDNVLFDGNPEWVRTAASLTNKPIIVLDLILRESQIDELYDNGADAVILIAALVNKRELQKIYHKANNLGLAVIVEIQDVIELQTALELGTKIIGINTRDINNLTRIDLNKIGELSKLIPSTVLIVAESGIKSPTDVSDYCQDADAVIVGSALLVDNNIKNNLARFATVFGRD